MVEFAPAGPELFRRGFAGDTFNTIWHIAQLMGPTADCGFVTRVGNDSHSDRFVAAMAADGLDTNNVSRDPDRQMGLYLIELDGAERRFHYWRQGSAAQRLADDTPALRNAICRGGLIHLSGITLSILSVDARSRLWAALREARQGGAIVSFDPNVRMRLWSSQEEARVVIDRMLGMTDIAMPSYDDERALWGDASPYDTAARIASYGVQEVIVKDGANPVHACLGGQFHTFSTPAANQVLDTTGAGDSFNGGYLAGRLLGLRNEPAVRLGQQLADEVIRTYGALAARERVVELRPKSEI
ncbi:sugar kinase [Devosia sp. SL43]|uniref:sugar kinase n=1 Tax=Devosia sp. SL43 TaxID=2806348 RepID=UPI001F2E08B9|nr:sugar kinase [Devosia sp. SL43]UJW87280.1 sugar kinase [Devosia sp. SL43]